MNVHLNPSHAKRSFAKTLLCKEFANTYHYRFTLCSHTLQEPVQFAQEACSLHRYVLQNYVLHDLDFLFGQCWYITTRCLHSFAMQART